MARLKTGGRPLLVLFRWGFVISVGQIVVISRSEPPQRSRESKAVSEGVPPRACPCDIITRSGLLAQWISCRMRSDQIIELIGLAFGAVALLSLAYLAYMLLS